MMDSRIIELLKEMKDNCLNADIFDDPKRNDKAEALNFAIFAVEKIGKDVNMVKWVLSDNEYCPCPICGRMPRVSYVDGIHTASCRGGFFKHHPLITVTVFRVRAQDIDTHALMGKWNNIAMNWVKK